MNVRIEKETGNKNQETGGKGLSAQEKVKSSNDAA